MGVSDGQNVDAAVSNAAWISKNTNDTMPNTLAFTSSLPANGASISSIQAAVNRLYTASGASESASGTVYNAPSNTIDNGDPYLSALRKLASKFHPSTGHFHTGASGDGPLLSVSSIQNSPTIIEPVSGFSFIGASGGAFAWEGHIHEGVHSIAASGQSGIKGDALLVAGAGISLSQSGQNIIIAASGGGMAGGDPTIQIFTSGSGTYTTPVQVAWIRVRAVGGGGGGGGGQTVAGASAGAGVAGGATTFGPITANGGAGAGDSVSNTTPGPGGAGGSASLGVGPVGIALTGGKGQGGDQTTTGHGANGGSGASSPFGGSGGGGGGVGELSFSGAGGGSGGYVDAVITSPDASYSYSVGSGGSGGTGSGGANKNGGSGASGYIVVEEYYS